MHSKQWWKKYVTRSETPRQMRSTDFLDCSVSTSRWSFFESAGALLAHKTPCFARQGLDRESYILESILNCVSYMFLLFEPAVFILWAQECHAEVQLLYKRQTDKQTKRWNNIWKLWPVFLCSMEPVRYPLFWNYYFPHEINAPSEH